MINTIVSAKHKAVGVPYASAIANLFPEALRMDIGGSDMLVVPHRPTETFWLRRMGYNVAAPILHHYDFPHPPGQPPFDVQKKTCALMTMEPRSYILSSMGTGKTRSALWAWDYLRSNNACGKLLVVATLSNLDDPWRKEIFACLPERTHAILHHSSRAKRIERLNSDAEIYIINHDGFKLMVDEILANKDIDALLIDELAAYRNGGSDRTKAMKKLASHMKWVWGMTGSPIPTSPTDAWAEATIVTPHTVPKYFGAFRSQLMLKVPNSPFKWKPKEDAVERAFAALQPSVRFTLDDVTELPECIERWQDIPLGPIQATLYRDMMRHAKISIQNNDITAVNAGAVMQKLLQISLGWVYNRDGQTVTLDNNIRVQTVIDRINEANNKVLVFSPFKHALKGISDKLTSEGIDHATVSGDTSFNERSTIFSLFQNTTKYKVINAHPQCLAHGLTLTSADTIIWNGPVTSLEIYSQANARIRRVGQRNKQLILHLQATPVEKKIYKLLKNNQQVQDALLQLVADATEITTF